MKKLHSELSVMYSNALAMLSIEKNLVRDSIDFNPNVIDMVAKLKNRRAKFLFKSLYDFLENCKPAYYI